MQELSQSKVKLYPEVKDIGNDLQSLKSDIGYLAAHVKEEGLHDLQEKAQEGYKNVQAYEKKIEERIKNYPLQSLAVAFLGGLAASHFLGRN